MDRLSQRCSPAERWQQTGRSDGLRTPGRRREPAVESGPPELLSSLQVRKEAGEQVTSAKLENVF